MLMSIAAILLTGSLAGWVCRKAKLPGLMGMLLTGILLGPWGASILDDKILSVSGELRKIALLIILLRAGLGLDTGGLRKLGRPAFLLCFVPASAELLGVLLLGHRLLGLGIGEAAVLGAVLAAVSPAVVVPRMVKLQEEGYGTRQGVPQMILAGASVDDVYVIVLFSTFTDMLSGGSISALRFLNIPISIALGILIGAAAGWLLSQFFRRFPAKTPMYLLITLCTCMLLTELEDRIPGPITFSSLIAVMVIGIALQKCAPVTARELSAGFGDLWIPAEVFLFVLVGASVNIRCLQYAGAAAVLVILGALVFRMAGTALCTLGTVLTPRERFFTMLAYTPKATVQAAIGSIPLSMGLACGDTVLTAAVLAILITAPLGALAIDRSYTRLLKKAD